MKFMQLSIVCIAFALLATVSAEKGEGKGKGKGKWGGHGKNMTCKGEPLLDAMALWKGKKECIEELAPATEEPLPEDEDKKNEVLGKRWRAIMQNSCISVCSKKKQGILSEDGTLNESGLEAQIKATIPEKAQTEMIDALKACYNDNFKTTTPSMDNECESYKDFLSCTKTTFFKVCEIKMPHLGKKGGKGKDKEGEEDNEGGESGEQ